MDGFAIFSCWEVENVTKKEYPALFIENEFKEVPQKKCSSYNFP